MNKQAKIALVVGLFLIGILAVALVVAPPPSRHCKDGNDNDGDGLVDWPADPGCSSKNDRTETDAALVCDNDQDESDDADTLADFRVSGGDPGCTSATDTSEVDGQCDDRQRQYHYSHRRRFLLPCRHPAAA